MNFGKAELDAERDWITQSCQQFLSTAYIFKYLGTQKAIFITESGENGLLFTYF